MDGLSVDKSKKNVCLKVEDFFFVSDHQISDKKL